MLTFKKNHDLVVNERFFIEALEDDHQDILVYVLLVVFIGKVIYMLRSRNTKNKTIGTKNTKNAKGVAAVTSKQKGYPSGFPKRGKPSY